MGIGSGSWKSICENETFIAILYQGFRGQIKTGSETEAVPAFNRPTNLPGQHADVQLIAMYEEQLGSYYFSFISQQQLETKGGVNRI